MAAGLVSHNITTASGVTFGVISWVPDTSAPDVGAVPIARITDGTSVAAVKAASTAPAATDPAVVVTISPNTYDLTVGTGGLKTPRVSIDTSQLGSLLTTAQAMAANYQLVGLPTDQNWGVGATGFTKLEDAASADGDKGVPAFAVRTDTPVANANVSASGDYLPLITDNKGKAWVAGAYPEDTASADADPIMVAGMKRAATPANTSGTDGDYEPLQGSGGYAWVHDNKGLSNLAFSAAFSTLTRPANQTPYSIGDSISDNATAGSVTALSATIADVNDDPIFISEILITSTDTGLAGKRIRAYLFNSDPTASSGVSGGDNAAYAQKKAGYIGSFSGVLESGFSDGTVGRLVPTFADGAAASTPHAMAGGFVVTKPTSGAKTLYIQYQAVDAFTSSANSTTIIGTARGWQGRAV